MGVKVYDRASQAVVEVDPAVAAAGISEGKYAPAQPRVKVVRAGQTGEVDADMLPEARAHGWELSDDSGVAAERDRIEAYSTGGQLRGGAEALASGATLGLSSVALEAAGVDPAELAARREALGAAGTGLELLGAALPAVVTGGTSAAGSGAAAGRGLASRALAATPSGLLTRGAIRVERGLAGHASSRIVPAGARNFVEAAGQGVGEQLDENVLGDRDLNADLLNSGILGGVFGVGAGLGIEGLASVAAGTRQASIDGMRGVLGRMNAASGGEATKAVAEWASRKMDGLVDLGERNAIAQGLDEQTAGRLAGLARTDEGVADIARIERDWRTIEADAAVLVAERLPAVHAAMQEHARRVSNGASKEAYWKRLFPKTIEAQRAAVGMSDELGRNARGAIDALAANNRAASATYGGGAPFNGAMLKEADGIVAALERKLDAAGFDVDRASGAKRQSYASMMRRAAPAPATADDAAALFRDSDMVSDLVKPGRNLENFHGAFRGATADEVDAIAMGEIPTKNSTWRFEPVRVVYQPGEEGFPAVVLRDGNHRLAAARAAGAKRVMADVYYGDDVVRTPIRIDGVQAPTAPSMLDAAVGKAMAIDQYKRALGDLIDVNGGWGKLGHVAPEVRATNYELRKLYHAAKSHLERADVYDEAAEAQLRINGAYGAVADADDAFRDMTVGSGLSTLVDANKVVNIDKALKFVRAQGRIGGDVKVARLTDALDARIAYFDEVAKYVDMDDAAKAAQEKLRGDVKALKDDFARQAKDAAVLDDLRTARAVETQGSPSAFTAATTFAGMMGFSLGGPLGALGGFALAAMRQPYTSLKRYAAIRHALNKADVDLRDTVRKIVESPVTQQAGRALAVGGRAAARVARGVGRGARAAAVAAAGRAAVTEQDRRRDMALERAAMLAQSPAAIEKALAVPFYDLHEAAPGLAGVMQQRIQVAANYLSSKAPKVYRRPYSDAVLVDPVSAASFERALEAVTKPLEALRRFQTGRITGEAAEAIRIVYPALFADVQRQIQDELAKAAAEGRELPYDRRVQLGLYFSTPTDPSLQPAVAGEIQLAIGAQYDEGEAAEVMQPSGKAGTFENPGRTSRALQTTSERAGSWRTTA